MNVSFIVTSFDIRTYLAQCLRSVAQVARPGDEVIVVDDGSTDGSAELIASGLGQMEFDPGVTLHPICLGANTMGGVGIPANIGLSLATKDVVFFVDGDDWIIPAGFDRARAQMTLTPADILIANYRVFDETRQTFDRPADGDQWHRSAPAGDLHALRRQALSMIGVPWRKFYCRAFLSDRRLRFPEGDFFYEDNPFHWAVCLAAGSIRFLDTAVCQHRMNRPGQTMGESGMALAAFFTHFQTIIGMLDDGDTAHHVQAVTWLLENMAWHADRLSADALYPYAVRAAALLAAIPAPIWAEAVTAGGHLHPVKIWAQRLRQGDVAGQVASWQSEKLHRRLLQVEAQLTEIAETSRRSLDRLRGQDAADRFIAIKAMHDL